MSRRAHGLRAWLLQRVSAVYLALFVLTLAVYLPSHPVQSHAQWRELLGAAPVNLATALFSLAVALHAWVGVRDVIMDYVRPAMPRLALLALVLLVLAGCVLWALRILFLAAP